MSDSWSTAVQRRGDPLPWGRPVMLAIAGDSAAGKTTLARGLVQALGPERITAVCVDDYFRYDRAERRALPFTPRARIAGLITSAHREARRRASAGSGAARRGPRRSPAARGAAVQRSRRLVRALNGARHGRRGIAASPRRARWRRNERGTHGQSTEGAAWPV